MHKNLKGIKFEDLILFSNDHYLIINKPSHIATLKDRHDPIDILSLAREFLPDIQACHRLDKETSGILVLAKHPEAYRHFAMMLERRQVKKVYHAVVDGVHDFQNVEADYPIYSTNGKSRIDFRAGKPSLTLISTLEVYKKNTLIKCFPVTGRLHQIRIHLSHLQAPVSCDPLYGGQYIFLSEIKKKYSLGKFKEEQPLIRRVALHAYSIAFYDFGQEDEKIIEMEAPYPNDFAVLTKQLRKYL